MDAAHRHNHTVLHSSIKISFPCRRIIDHIPFLISKSYCICCLSLDSSGKSNAACFCASDVSYFPVNIIYAFYKKPYKLSQLLAACQRHRIVNRGPQSPTLRCPSVHPSPAPLLSVNASQRLVGSPKSRSSANGCSVLASRGKIRIHIDHI